MASLGSDLSLKMTQTLSSINFNFSPFIEILKLLMGNNVLFNNLMDKIL